MEARMCWELNNMDWRILVFYPWPFILSNFNYCPVIWHFCSETNTKKMEKNQERALKFIHNENHSTYEELLAKSKLPSLKIRRIRTIAISGADPGFQVRGGALKNFGVFRVKNHDFTPKKIIFFQF
jgi:hypothetical protein